MDNQTLLERCNNAEGMIAILVTEAIRRIQDEGKAIKAYCDETRTMVIKRDAEPR